MNFLLNFIDFIKNSRPDLSASGSNALYIVRRPSFALTFHIFDFSSDTTERNFTRLYRKPNLNALYPVCTPWLLIGWDIFAFSCETHERNPIKLGRKQYIFYQVFVFRANQKNQMATLASYLLRHFRLLHWHRWTKFNETWQEARSQWPLTSVCFSGLSKKKPRWPPWPLIGWDIFDFSSETTEQNATRLYRMPNRNALYPVCTPWQLIGWDFLTSPLKPLDEIQLNLTGSKILTSSKKFVFFRADRKNKMAILASDWLRFFRFLLWNRWTELN